MSMRRLLGCGSSIRRPASLIVDMVVGNGRVEVTLSEAPPAEMNSWRTGIMVQARHGKEALRWT
jgi:hypothetical protein